MSVSVSASVSASDRIRVFHLPNIDGLDVKRKYHVQKTREVSMGPKPQLSKWWFIISGEEPVLQLLMEKWNAVSYQTNWTLEPVLTFCDAEIATIGQSDGDGQVLDQHNAQAHILLKQLQQLQQCLKKHCNSTFLTMTLRIPQMPL